jgi:hypothetical protein
MLAMTHNSVIFNREGEVDGVAANFSLPVKLVN